MVIFHSYVSLPEGISVYIISVSIGWLKPMAIKQVSKPHQYHWPSIIEKVHIYIYTYIHITFAAF